MARFTGEAQLVSRGISCLNLLSYHPRSRLFLVLKPSSKGERFVPVLLREPPRRLFLPEESSLSILCWLLAFHDLFDRLSTKRHTLRAGIDGARRRRALSALESVPKRAGQVYIMPWVAALLLF